MTTRQAKKLPIGISQLRSIVRSNAYYVDKTQLAMRLLDNLSEGSTILFTRPRRFGKSLALDMLHCFFDCNAKEQNRPLFDGLAIASSECHMAEFGKYPVIRLSFNGAKYDNWKQAEECMAPMLSRALRSFRYLQESQELDKDDRADYARLCSSDTPLAQYAGALALVSKMLYHHHGQPVIILIDEYDVPIQGAYQGGYFEEMIRFMRSFFTNGLKDNAYLRLAVLTGVMRIAKESLFSGLNNLAVDTILSTRYADCFGFTQDEVTAMASYYSQLDRVTELKEWYDGYRFGENDIYNPWSVLRYFDNECRPEPYWMDTSSNDLTIDFLRRLEKHQRDRVWELYRGGTVEATVDTSVSYQQLQSCDANTVFSLMAVTGYLKPVQKRGHNRYMLQVPNAEINTIFFSEILSYMERGYQITALQKLGDALLDNDLDAFTAKLKEVLLQSASYFDGTEAFYQGFMTCLLLGLDENYKVLSNREAGLGRADILLQPRFDKSLPGLVFEFKQGNKNEGLEQLAETALQQIVEKRYAAAFPPEIKKVRCYGLAFCGKECVIKELAISN